MSYKGAMDYWRTKLKKPLRTKDSKRKVGTNNVNVTGFKLINGETKLKVTSSF